MRWVPYATLFAVAAAAGAASYWLWGQKRMFDVAGLMGMALLVLWHLYADYHIDEVNERDARIAKKERQSWGE